MGTRTYDFLTDSFLFDSELLDAEFAPMSEDALLEELRRYRQFCLSNGETLLSEVRANPSNLKVFSNLGRVSLDQLKRSALYIHQYVLDDPLIPLAAPRSQLGLATNQLLGFQQKLVDRGDLAARIRFLKQITPMVAGNFVKLLPVSIVFEPPKELPLFASDNYFDDALPTALLKIFRERAQVESLQKTADGWAETGELFPCRAILIRFDGHPRGQVFIYNYFDTEASVVDEAKRLVEFKMTMPDTPPPPAAFQAWVRQSVNQASRALYSQTFTEAMIANDLGALYSTRSELIAEALGTTATADSSISGHSATVLMNMELPFLKDMDVEKLMRVRQEEGEAFENFRTELDKQLRDLRTIDDPKQARIKAENALHELSEVQIREINNKVASLKEKAIVTAGVAATGLVAAVQTGGLSLLATAVAALKGAEVVLDYRKEIKRHPAFFLWKTVR
jgi:hypothetical protein